MNEKVALVTGGSKGIGAACVKALGQNGFKVAVHYRSDPDLASDLVSNLPEACAFQYDLGEDGAADILVKEVKKKYGRIDVLVNNAGHSIDQLIPFAKPADFDSLLTINLKSVFLLTKHCSRLMIKQKSGSIINISSVVGHTGNAGQSMYAATKSAITGFTMSIAKDLAPYQIRANCVAPGFIETKMTSALSDEVKESILANIPLGRLGQSDEVADAVRFLASQQASYITGSTIHVNGGMYTN
ncbi:MAG: 3-oxoacyl-ACP reductase family protein [Oligoflexales bacterium]